MKSDAWNSTLAILEKMLNPGLFQLWIKPLSAQADDDTLHLQAPNEFVASWVRDRLLEPITQAATQALGRPASITVTSKAGEQAKAAGGKVVMPPPPQAVLRNGASRAGEQLSLPLGGQPPLRLTPRWRFRFDDFVVGPSNQLAHAASCSICRDASPSPQLFLCAGPGLGKTHLLQAIGHHLCEANDSAKPVIACLTAEEFTTRMIMAIKAREVEKFKSMLRDIDVLLLEDVHFLQGKARTQDELLATLEALAQRGSRIVLTSSFLPKELQNLDSSLSSRLSSGFLALIDKPDFQTRLRILESKAEKFQAFVPAEVSSLLAERITTDVRQLESCLQNLILKARLLNTRITEDLAWQELANYDLKDAGFSFEKILETVCNGYDLAEKELKSKSRKRHVVLARNTAFYLARKHTELSLAAIGRRLGRRHSTVLKGITNIEREMSRQTPLGRQIQQTIERLE
ncbi:MAG: chromosomal replication initiator protein DnaA [Desulfovibrionaceae bacterium]